MRRSLLVTAAAVTALSAVPATADAASQAARIKKLEAQVAQLTATVKILRNRDSLAQRGLALLLTEYYCTPYLLLPPELVGAGGNSKANNGTWSAWILAERDFGVHSGVQCGNNPAPPSAPAAAATTALPGPTTLEKPVPSWARTVIARGAAKG